MTLGEFTAVMVTLNVAIQCVALWQRHQSASEARRRRVKRAQKQREKEASRVGQ